MSTNTSEYAPAGGGGSINLIGSSHPEPKRDDPSADQMTREELLRQLKWTDDQLATAGACGFPSPRYQLYTRRGCEYRYSRQTVAAWLERVRSLKVR
jgi:hypothetical protein